MRMLVCLLLLVWAGQLVAQENHVEERLSGLTIKGLPADLKGFYFLIVGDWGRNGQGEQQKVADWMGVAANQVKAKFVISTGDNFYCCGVASTNDYQWISSFENVYRSHSLQIPWYAVLGNHDYQGNVSAQIAYTGVSQRWKMPARYFTMAIRDIRFVFLDTSPLITSYHAGEQYGDLHQQDTTRQLQWMDSVLTKAKEKWKIVVGHHPVYSVGDHGGEKDLQRLLEKRLLRHHVQVYIAGHDHNLQSLQPPNQNLLYLISGGGAEVTPVRNDPALARYANATPGFMVVSVVNEEIKFYFINQSGQLLYTETVMPSGVAAGIKHKLK